ncbi:MULTISPECIES: MFS transporter [Streptomyces]|nr:MULTISPECIES: MFS transporter [Streptomyces]
MTDTVTVPDRPQTLAASVGNAVEWYDWSSCTGTLAAYHHAPDLQCC